jgi:hypothetical protein
MFVIQTRFIGIFGNWANQFFGGIGTYSHAPLWVNLLADAVKYKSAAQAQQVLDEIHERRSKNSYSVVAVSEADETASKPHPAPR